jgi:hypothetical protein
LAVRCAIRGVLGLPFAIDSVLLAGMLVSGVGPAGTSLALAPSAGVLAHPSVTGSEARFTVDPPSFWMRSGTNLSLQAVWLPESPLCNVTPLWYYWSTAGTNATGFLNTTIGSRTTFTADSFETGTLSLIVVSDAELDCGMGATIVSRTSEANVSIVVPLSISHIELGPNPTFPGATSILQGYLVGGQAGYEVAIAWGDGTHSILTLPTPGAFSIDHAFPAGEFVPSLIASDSGGDTAVGSVDEAISVGSGLEVAVLPASSVAEVGVPLNFTGLVSNRPPGAITLYDCSNTTVAQRSPALSTTTETSFSCTFDTPGTAEVLFGAYSSVPGGPSATAVLYETVVPLPQVSVRSVEAVGEVGGVGQVHVSVGCGTAPFELSWNLSGNQSGGEATLLTDGSGVITFTPESAGEFVIGIRVSDALGSVEWNNTATIRVDPHFESNATGASTLLTNDAIATIDGSAVSGCLPFSWWVVPGVAPANESVRNGTLASDGDFVWTGSYASEGNLSVAVEVFDACGAAQRTVLTLTLVPPIWAKTEVEPGPTNPVETLAVNLSIGGGLPPFRLDVSASDNESWNRTVPSDGDYRWLLATHANGSVSIEISVWDVLGTSLQTNLTVDLVSPRNSTVPSPPITPPPPATTLGFPGNSTSSTLVDPTVLALVVLVPIGAAGTFLILRRRHARPRPQTGTGVDPVTTLQRIIEPADGAERFTVELLAEEAGIPLETVRSTIDRLVTEGKVLAESGADGEEVLSWSRDAGH